jgi:hypothetical protein
MGNKMNNIKINKQEAIFKIQSLSLEGNKVHELILSGEITSFSQWQDCVINLLKSIFYDYGLVSKFEAETVYLENSFSKLNTKMEASKAISRGIKFLSRLMEDISNDLYKDELTINNEIPKEIAIIIIERILNNFYKHLQEMYQSEVHGKAKILKCDLDKIKIGNEYDVQRILYSIIKPVFPSARVEVTEDNGYNSMRYDIFIDEYDIVIEVKCTRKNMNERQLTEELGSDIFHYNPNILFFFIYDKENIIRNVDAFTKAYTRKDDTLSKSIETIVIQPVVL